MSLTGSHTVVRAFTGDELFLVDGDSVARDAWSLVFWQAGFRVAGFADGPSFVATARKQLPAAAILDLRLHGRSALDVLDEIDAPRYGAPVLVSSGREDIPIAVEAIKRGAVDFLERHSNPEALVARVRNAIGRYANDLHRSDGFGAPERPFRGSELLTPREHAVLALIASGASNQHTADELRISRRTVEVHRAHLCAKLNARNVADLVRITMSRDRGPA